MRALMVQGTSSWAGKSLITTALCRHLARRGVRVAPFKAQNMSNNVRVVAGGEIGVAQYLQARAAGVEPDVRMNPVLVKPEGMTQSQVVIRGRVDPERLAALTGVPVLGVVPWLAHQLPDEDGAATSSSSCEGGPVVVIVRYPTASNLDEFKPLEQVARVRWARTVAELDGSDLVVLPGSKHVAADLAWLRSAGLTDLCSG